MNNRSSFRLYAGLFSLAMASTFAWLGLTGGSGILRFSGWYIGAIVFAITGILLLRPAKTASQTETADSPEKHREVNDNVTSSASPSFSSQKRSLQF